MQRRERAHRERVIALLAEDGRDVVATKSSEVDPVTAADLVETLKSPGPFTVFAPTNAAFDTLSAGTVDRLVQPGQRRQTRKSQNQQRCKVAESSDKACAPVCPALARFATTLAISP